MPKPNKNQNPVITNSVLSFLVLETTAPGTPIADIDATDANGDTLAYSITGGNDDGIFAIDQTTGVITIASGMSLDSDLVASYALLVSVTDGKGGTATATVTVTVDPNDAPTGIELDDSTFLAGTGGAVVGTLTAIDPDAGDSHTFSVSDSNFEVSGNQLRVKSGVSLAPGEYEVTVTTTDRGGLTHEQTLTVTATTAPPFSGVIDLGDRSAWSGFTVNGEGEDGTGFILSAAGDVNGDGIADMLVGALNTSDAYVIYGKGLGGTFSDIDVATLSSADGFKISNGTVLAGVGKSLASAGDINGDGIDDLLIGGPFGDAPRVHVIYGKAGGYDGEIVLPSPETWEGFTVFGPSGSASGISVSSAGDVNGDGTDDFIIGDSEGDGSGRKGSAAGDAYVIFGKNTDLDGAFADIDLASLNPADGFRIRGGDGFDLVGASVSSAGDINMDGFADLIIGAYNVRSDGRGMTGEGAAYVIFGKTDIGDIDLRSLAPADGFRILGVDDGDWTGMEVSNAGDVNGDGYDDMLVGADRSDGEGNLKEWAGDSYVIFGKAGGFTEIDLATLSPADGIRISGADAGDRSGASLAAAGDVNGDGIDDFLISAPRGGGADNLEFEAGEVYLVFGKQDLSDIDLANFTLADGIVFYGAEAGDLAGWTVDGAGDVNSDGYDDLMIGSIVNTAYIVFGQDFDGDTLV